jgi:hypothetical protein
MGKGKVEEGKRDASTVDGRQSTRGRRGNVSALAGSRVGNWRVEGVEWAKQWGVPMCLCS